MPDDAAHAATTLPSPHAARLKIARLSERRAMAQTAAARNREALKQVRDYLAISDQVSSALDSLSEQLFSQLIGVLEETLSVALQEVLSQPIQLKAEVSHKRGSISVDFHVERDGEKEDILKGQGGSVANVLSVGLRMFALHMLDDNEHRRVLILDEQDCWLRPDLGAATGEDRS